MKKRASTGKVQTKKQLEQAIAAYQKLAEEAYRPLQQRSH